MMKFFSVLAFLLSPAALAADEPSSEEIFALLCHRKPPASAASDDLKLRQEFQRFLRSPQLTVRALERSLRSDRKDIGDSIEELFLYSSTCHLADTHAQELRQQGCFNAKGRRLAVDEAIRLCAPVAANFKAAALKTGPGSEESERRAVMDQAGPLPAEADGGTGSAQ